VVARLDGAGWQRNRVGPRRRKCGRQGRQHARRLCLHHRRYVAIAV